MTNTTSSNEEIKAATEQEQQKDEKKKAKTKSLSAQLEEAKQTAEEYKDLLQRLQAEFENYRKRTAESARISRGDGICDVIIELLPVIDNFERGLAVIQDQTSKSGMELILKQLKDILKKFDVCEIEAMGQAFNPDMHHAIAKEESGEAQDDGEIKVVEVYSKGYRNKTKILRPAMVKVSK